MKKFLLLLWVLPGIAAYSQDRSKDSLLQIVKAGKEDRRTALAWSDLAGKISWGEPDSIMLCGRKALELGEKLRNDTAVFFGYHAIATANYITSKFNKGIEAGMMAYRLARKDSKANWEAMVSNTLGFLYNAGQKFKEAIPFFETSVNYNRSKNNKRSLASSLNNLANAYMGIGDFKHSLYCRMESISLRKELNLLNALGDCYNDLGEMYMMLTKTDSAHKYYQLAFRIKQKTGDVEMMALSGLNIAKTLRQKGQLKEAFPYLDIAELCATEIHSNQYLYEIYREKSLCYKGLGKFSEAYELLEKHILYKDSVINLESRKQLNELNEEFQSEKKMLEIEGLKKEKQKDIEIANERDKRKNSVLFLSGFILVAIGIYTFLLFKRFKLTRQQKAIIEKQKHVVEEKQKEILDSIYYARRIQRSLLTTEKYIHSRLIELQKKK